MMKDLNLHALSAHVVAWHNRHPLARRITAAQVHSVGYVALPFLAGASAPGGAQASAQDATQANPVDISQVITQVISPDISPIPAADASSGATLRERAMARAQGTDAASAPGAEPASASASASASAPATAVAPAAGPPPAPTGAALAAAFSEDFIPPLAPSRVASWAAVHGVALAAPPTDAPVRQVVPHGTADVERLRLLWVLTAQLEVGRPRTRVLVGAGNTPSVLGRRLWSRARIAGLAALGITLLAGAVALHIAGSVAPAASGVAPAAPAGSAAAAASAASTAVATVAATAAATVAATAAASSPPAVATATTAPAGAAEHALPVDVEPTLGRVTLPPIGPRADERRKAAEQAAQQAAEQAAQAQTALPPTTPAAVSTAGPAFAVATRLLRTRTESEQVAAAMRALLVTAGMPQMQVDVMPAGDDWRVVGWPYANRAQAEKSRALLARRGLRVEVIDF